MKKQIGIKQLVKVISFASLMLCIVVVMNSCGSGQEKAAEKVEVKDTVKTAATVTDTLKQPVDSSKDIIKTGGNKPQ
jgi:hypothetical protein